MLLLVLTALIRGISALKVHQEDLDVRDRHELCEDHVEEDRELVGPTSHQTASAAIFCDQEVFYQRKHQEPHEHY